MEDFDYRGHKTAFELTGKEQVFFTDPTTGIRGHTTLGELAKFATLPSSTPLTDESGNVLTDEAGNPLTP